MKMTFQSKKSKILIFLISTIIFIFGLIIFYLYKPINIKLNFENTFEKQNSFISIPNVSNQQINKIQEEFKQNFKYKDKINSHIYLNQDKKEIIIYWPKIRNFVNKEYLFATTFCKEETNNHIVETNCSLYFKIIKNDDEQFKIEILNPKIDLKIIQ